MTSAYSGSDMTKLPKHLRPTGIPAALVDLLPVYEVMPWENAEEYEALETALVGDLKPKTAHELVIARRIAALDWEYYRGASLLRDVFSACVQKVACKMLNEGKMDLISLFPQPANIECAGALVGEDDEARAKAIATLGDNGISLPEIRAQAFLQHVHEFEALERRPERNEARRRKLLQDLIGLQAVREQGKIEDAEIIPGNDH
jgi:hypothetical protein